MKEIKTKSGRVYDVLTALQQIQQVTQLSSRERRELCLALDGVWRQVVHRESVVVEGVESSSLALAGVARQIAWEFGLPYNDKMFKE